MTIKNSDKTVINFLIDSIEKAVDTYDTKLLADAAATLGEFTSSLQASELAKSAPQIVVNKNPDALDGNSLGEKSTSTTVTL